MQSENIKDVLISKLKKQISELQHKLDNSYHINSGYRIWKQYDQTHRDGDLPAIEYIYNTTIIYYMKRGKSYKHMILFSLYQIQCLIRSFYYLNCYSLLWSPNKMIGKYIKSELTTLFK